MNTYYRYTVTINNPESDCDGKNWKNFRTKRKALQFLNAMLQNPYFNKFTFEFEDLKNRKAYIIHPVREQG